MRRCGKAWGIGWLGIMLVLVAAANAGAATFDATGNWILHTSGERVVSTNIPAECQPDPDGSVAATIQQRGAAVTMLVPDEGLVLNGQVSGATYTAAASESDGPGETTLIQVQLALSSCQAGTGTYSIQYSEAYGPNHCTIVGQVTASRQGACPAVQPPAAPVLTGTTTGNRVNLSWGAVAGATGYRLVAGPVAPASWTPQEVDLGLRTGVAFALPAGISANVAIRAYNAAGVGPASNTVQVGAGGKPAAPALTGTATATGISLSWNAVTGATSYIVAMVPAGGQLMVADAGTATSFQRSFPAGTSVAAAVLARNQAGLSPPSNVVQLSVANQDDDHGNTCSQATTVAAGDTVAGSIETAGDTDVFRIELPGPGTLTVASTGSTDTFGTLQDASCADMATDDDSGAGTNFQLQRAFPARATVHVAVRHYSSQRTGAYFLQVTFAPQAASLLDAMTGTWQVGYTDPTGGGSWTGQIVVDPDGTIHTPDWTTHIESEELIYGQWYTVQGAVTGRPASRQLSAAGTGQVRLVETGRATAAGQVIGAPIPVPLSGSADYRLDVLMTPDIVLAPTRLTGSYTISFSNATGTFRPPSPLNGTVAGIRVGD
ncbi:MAG: fibronectin type III domain-containing protein [Thermodesulfobacteriota bacterium]